MLEFSHVDAVIDATESEEVGVEHLLRDINDPSVRNFSLFCPIVFLLLTDL